MTTQISVLLLGATGYIGGAVLSRLIHDPEASRCQVTVLVRNAEKARALQSFQVKALVGSLDDVETIRSLAAHADVVFECADADHIESTKAVLAGLKERYEKTGKLPALIHTSGTGVLGDNAAGMYATETIYYDNEPEQLDGIAPSQPHREVDLAVIEADKQGYVKVYIVLPSTIYGLEKNPLVDAGIMHPQSQQIPRLIRAGLARLRAGMVGEGKNIWPNVHINDVAELYKVIWMAVISGEEIGHGREGYYFGENGEHTLFQVGEGIGQALAELGLTDAVTPTTFTKEEIERLLGGSERLGSNSRCRAERSRSIGWDPKMATTDMLASIRPEVEYIRSGVGA